MRNIVASAVVFILLSASSCAICPLWDQGCDGKVETEGVDYIKYVGIVNDAETGKSLPGISGAMVRYHFNAVKKVPDQDVDVQTNPDGTFTLLASARRLPARITITAPGYEPYVIDVAAGQHQFVVPMKPLHESH